MQKARQAAGEPLWIDPKQNGRTITVHGFRSSFPDWAEERATCAWRTRRVRLLSSRISRRS
jgi:hypothetical protein